MADSQPQVQPFVEFEAIGRTQRLGAVQRLDWGFGRGPQVLVMSNSNQKWEQSEIEQRKTDR